MAKPKAIASAEARVAAAENSAGPLSLERALPKLRELGQAQDILDQWLEETEGEETPEIAALWEELQGDKREKVIRWGHHLLNRYAVADLMEAEMRFYKVEMERLAARLKAYAANTERSEAQLQMQLELQGIEAVESATVTVKLQANPPKVIGDLSGEAMAELFLNPDLQRFIRYQPEQFALDRNEIKAEAKANPAALAKWLPSDVKVVQAQRVVVK